MPYLSFEHPDPLAATLGIMLYPGHSKDERRKADAFSLKFLAMTGAMSRKHAGSWTADTLPALVQRAGGAHIADVEEHILYGSAIGLMVMHFHALAMANDPLASWATAQKVVLRNTGRPVSEGVSESQLKQKRGRFMPVAHLWGASAYRDFKFSTVKDVGYDGSADFHSFLTEAEILRQWGTTWQQRRSNAQPPFFGIDMWRPPETWSPPDRGVGWPMTGVIPGMLVPKHLLEGIRTAGKHRSGRS